MGYSGALDGIRALAVAVVIAYHAGLAEIPGGFLGVEVFFVVSGYLITALLDQELRISDSIDLRSFWRRRFRRLLPAAWAMVLATSVVTLLFWHDEAYRLARTVPAAIGYVTNWWFIIAKESYFEAAGRPPLLRHLWSLAIEEQFYLLLPLALAALHRAGVSVAQRAKLAVGLALGSLLVMGLVFTPFADPTRVYFGTDTRASGLLFGVALASVYRPWLTPLERERVPQVDALGAIGLLGLAALFLWANDYDAFIYRGGMLLVDVATVLVIIAAVHPAALWRTWLGVAPLRAIGVRSYSLYLWHWPVFALIRPQIDVPWGPIPTLALRLAIAVPLAELSYRLVERPIRAGVPQEWLGRRRREIRTAGDLRPPERIALGASSVALIAVVIGLVTATEPKQEAPPAPATTSTAPTTTSIAGTTTTTAAPSDHLYFLGDSVLLGISPTLKGALPTATVNAKVGRQFNQGRDIVRFLDSRDQLPTTKIVVMLGANGPIDESAVRDMVGRTGPDRIWFVNVHTARNWGPANNEALAALSQELGFEVIDWASLADAHPEWFRKDGTHPDPDGQRALVDLIAATLGSA